MKLSMFSSLFTDPYHYFRISSSNTYMYLIFMQKTKICKKSNQDLIKACWFSKLCNQKILNILKFRIETKNEEICSNQEISTYTYLPNSTWKQKKKCRQLFSKLNSFWKVWAKNPLTYKNDKKTKCSINHSPHTDIITFFWGTFCQYFV